MEFRLVDPEDETIKIFEMTRKEITIAARFQDKMVVKSLCFGDTQTKVSGVWK